MGKATKWFRCLIPGFKDSPDDGPNASPPNYYQPLTTTTTTKKKKKYWSFAEFRWEKWRPLRSRHGHVVAAAEAKLTNNNISQSVEEQAAVMIQSHYRGHLARRALRALRSLVKVQALVRGYLVRKQTVYALRGLRALAQAQARARAKRALVSQTPCSRFKSSHLNHPVPATPDKFEHVIQDWSMKHEQVPMIKRNGSKTNGRTGKSLWGQLRSYTRRNVPLLDDELSSNNNVIEVDTTGNGNPYIVTKRKRKLFPSSSYFNQTFRKEPSASIEAQPLNHSAQEDQSPQFDHSASSTGSNSGIKGWGAFKRGGSRSCLRGYLDHPNYMAYTESSKAKVRRSLSAPKQRPAVEYEGASGSTSKRFSSVYGYIGDSRWSSTALLADITNKAYPCSGRSDRVAAHAYQQRC